MTAKLWIGLALASFVLLCFNTALSVIGLSYIEHRRSEFRHAFAQIARGMERERVHELLASFGPPVAISEWWSQPGDFDRFDAILTHRPPDFVTIEYVDGKVVSAALENGDRIVAHRFDPATYSYLEYWSGSAMAILMMFDVAFLFCLEALVICCGLIVWRDARARIGSIVLGSMIPALIVGIFLSSLYSMLFYLLVAWL